MLKAYPGTENESDIIWTDYKVYCLELNSIRLMHRGKHFDFRVMEPLLYAAGSVSARFVSDHSSYTKFLHH